MNRRSLAHVWANRSNPKGRASNLYFEGDTIYSYGSHFPIARLLDDDAVLFTTRDYSPTTSQHKSAVLCAVTHRTVFHVENVTRAPSRDDIEGYRQRIDALALRLARKRSLGFYDTKQLSDLVAEANAFSARFKLRTRFTAPSNFDDLRARAKRDAVRKAAASRREAKRREAELQVKIQGWLAGETRFLNTDRVFLRVKGDTMETSRGAVVPLAKAEKAFRFATLKRSCGWHRNGDTFRVGDFQLDAVNEQGVVAGCHRVTWDEIERFATLQGWKQ